MKTFALALTAGAVSAISNIEIKFANYLSQHGKTYDTIEEFVERLEYFAELDREIEEHNATEANFTMGHNHMSDWSAAEKKVLRGRLNMPREYTNAVWFDESEINGYVDWKKKGAVTGVKDQGHCGTCWAFSSTGALEGEHFIKTGKLLSFSEQQLGDCVYSRDGCNGGNQSASFKYWESHKAETESAYPYTSGKSKHTGSCKYNSKSATAVEVKSYGNVTKDSVSQMKAAIAKQPLAISIDAESNVFNNYRSGVLDSSKCGTRLDHAVLATGWGHDSKSGLDYWEVKNSWGKSWGDKGYIKIAIEDGKGICGIQMEPETVNSN